MKVGQRTCTQIKASETDKDGVAQIERQPYGYLT